MKLVFKKFIGINFLTRELARIGNIGFQYHFEWKKNWTSSRDKVLLGRRWEKKPDLTPRS